MRNQEGRTSSREHSLDTVDLSRAENYAMSEPGVVRTPGILLIEVEFLVRGRSSGYFGEAIGVAVRVEHDAISLVPALEICTTQSKTELYLLAGTVGLQGV